jgi:hypothetical protein
MENKKLCEEIKGSSRFLLPSNIFGGIKKKNAKNSFVFGDLKLKIKI